VKIGETNGAGMIMKLAIQNDIIYSAIFGGCVHTHDYATLSEIFRTRLIGTIYLNLILPYILTIQGVPGDLSGKVNVPNTWTPVFDLYGNSGVTVLKEHGSSNIQRRATSPVSLRLSQNYPNPFNAETTIRFYVQETSHVSLKIYNLLGCKVAELVNSKLGPGDYSQTFDASNLASGIYFYRIQMNDYIAVKKMVLLE
jgi:hypothetical protein